MSDCLTGVRENEQHDEVITCGSQSGVTRRLGVLESCNGGLQKVYKKLTFPHNDVWAN